MKRTTRKYSILLATSAMFVCTDHVYADNPGANAGIQEQIAVNKQKITTDLIINQSADGQQITINEQRGQLEFQAGESVRFTGSEDLGYGFKFVYQQNGKPGNFTLRFNKENLKGSQGTYGRDATAGTTNNKGFSPDFAAEFRFEGATVKKTESGLWGWLAGDKTDRFELIDANGLGIAKGYFSQKEGKPDVRVTGAGDGRYNVRWYGQPDQTKDFYLYDKSQFDGHEIAIRAREVDYYAGSSKEESDKWIQEWATIGKNHEYSDWMDSFDDSEDFAGAIRKTTTTSKAQTSREPI